MANDLPKLDATLSVIELAALIAALPDGTDLSALGLVKALLTNGDPDKRDPAKYTAVFTEAASRAKSPWMIIASTIQRINGLRRDPNADMREVAEKANELADRIMVMIPPGPLQWQLGGQIGYEQTLLFRMTREYYKAASASVMSAMYHFAIGETTKGDISVFLGTVESMSAAFVSGEHQRIDQAFEAMLAMRNAIKAKSSYPGWMMENAHIHIWWAWVMIGLIFTDHDHLPDYPDLQDDSRLMEAKITAPHWHDLFKIWDMYEEDQFDECSEAIYQLEGVYRDMKSSSINNVILTAKLINSEILSITGQRKASLATLGEVAAWSGWDGGVPMAIARRRLAQFATF